MAIVLCEWVFFQKARKKSKPSVHVQTNVATQGLATSSCLPLFFLLFFLEWLRLYVFLQRPLLLHRRSWSACSARLFCFSSAFRIANKSLYKCRLTSVNKKKGNNNFDRKRRSSQSRRRASFRLMARFIFSRSCSSSMARISRSRFALRRSRRSRIRALLR